MRLHNNTEIKKIVDPFIAKVKNRRLQTYRT